MLRVSGWFGVFPEKLVEYGFWIIVIVNRNPEFISELPVQVDDVRFFQVIEKISLKEYHKAFGNGCKLPVMQLAGFEKITFRGRNQVFFRLNPMKTFAFA